MLIEETECSLGGVSQVELQFVHSYFVHLKNALAWVDLWKAKFPFISITLAKKMLEKMAWLNKIKQIGGEQMKNVTFGELFCNYATTSSFLIK